MGWGLKKRFDLTSIRDASGCDLLVLYTALSSCWIFWGVKGVVSVISGVKVEHWIKLLGYHSGQHILLTLYAASTHHGDYFLETDF